MIVNLVIGSFELPIHTTLNFQQTYSHLRARNTRRLADGTAVLRQTWSDKLETNISCAGWIPSGLTVIDYSLPITIKCAAPLSASDTDETAVLPADRRTDVSLAGWAIVNGEPVKTTVNDVTNNVATLVTVSGATLYRVDYYPEFSAFIEEPVENMNADSAEFSWSLTAQQI